jgi:hypothetical protein
LSTEHCCLFHSSEQNQFIHPIPLIRLFFSHPLFHSHIYPHVPSIHPTLSQPLSMKHAQLHLSFQGKRLEAADNAQHSESSSIKAGQLSHTSRNPIYLAAIQHRFIACYKSSTNKITAESEMYRFPCE